jgi:hypothetical protein
MSLRIQNITPTATEIVIRFSEDVKRKVAEDLSNYEIESPVGSKLDLNALTPTVQRTSDKRSVTITFSRPTLRLGDSIRVRTTNMKPRSGKATNNVLTGFSKGGDSSGGITGSSERLPREVDDAIKAVRDLSSYPFQTTGVSAPPTTPGGTGSTALKNLVDAAMKTALGRLPNSGDTRSFVGALNQSFMLSEAEGHTVVTWTPRNLSGTSELGAGVTGAQASLAAFAQDELNSTLPLIDGLYPLLPDADREEVAAARSILRMEWIQFVEELQTEGGPRAPRADQLADRLKRMHLPRLGKLLGMVEVDSDGVPTFDSNDNLTISRENVILPEEEQNLTSFIRIDGSIFSVITSWNRYRKDFFKKDLGTGLVLLGRSLSVVVETVDEVYAAMDSVFVGAAERTVANVSLKGKKDMTVEELLSWVRTFAAEDAVNLIQEGGKRGVEAIIEVTNELCDSIIQFLDLIDRDTPELPDGLRQRRVRNPLNELVDYLLQVKDQAEKIAYS